MTTASGYKTAKGARMTPEYLTRIILEGIDQIVAERTNERLKELQALLGTPQKAPTGRYSPEFRVAVTAEAAKLAPGQLRKFARTKGVSYSVIHGWLRGRKPKASKAPPPSAAKSKATKPAKKAERRFYTPEFKRELLAEAAKQPPGSLKSFLRAKKIPAGNYFAWRRGEPGAGSPRAAAAKKQYTPEFRGAVMAEGALLRRGALTEFLKEKGINRKTYEHWVRVGNKKGA